MKVLSTVLNYVIVLFLMTSTVSSASTMQHSKHKLIGSHGMVIIHDPETGFYASHMPLYSSPHDYQIVYKITIEEPKRLERMLSTGMVTILPDVFDLRRLINGDTFSLQAKFYQGHFERAGEMMFTAKVSFAKQQFSQAIKQGYQSSFSEFYITPINSDKAIIIHKIQAPPSFDAISIIEIPFMRKTPLISCKKPQQFDSSTIKQILTNCGIKQVKYLETLDFRG